MSLQPQREEQSSSHKGGKSQLKKTKRVLGPKNVFLKNEEERIEEEMLLFPL